MTGTAMTEASEFLDIYGLEVIEIPTNLPVSRIDEDDEIYRTQREKLAAIAWDKASISAAMKETLATHGLKMPQLAPAVRVMVCARAQTPSIDAVLELFPRDTVLTRLQAA